MSRIVTGLKRKGLAATITDTADARRIRIQATAKGVQLMQRGRKRRIQSLTAMIAELEADELETIGRAVAALEKVLRK